MDEARILVVHPPCDERRELVSLLFDHGFEVLLADDAGRALRAVDGGVEGLIVRPGERKLALKTLLRSMQGKPAAFVIGTPTDAEAFGRAVEVEAEPISGSPEEMVAAVAARLGAAAPQAGPTLVAERGLWQSPRGSVKAVVARQDERIRVAFLATECGWAEGWRDAFVDNMKRASELGHPRLGRVDLAWVEETEVRAIWPLPEGRPLSDQLVGTTLDVEEAVPLIRALVEAMTAMHGASPKMTFGPVSAEQVWLAEDGPRFLLAGASRIAFNYDRALRGRARAPLAILASPEELGGAGATPQTDTFYAAVFLYRLLTGAEPFSRSDVVAYHEAIRAGDFRDIRLYTPSLDDGVASRLHSALSPDPEKRPPLDELAEALARAEASPPDPEPEPPARKRKSWQFWRLR